MSQFDEGLRLREEYINELSQIRERLHRLTRLTESFLAHSGDPGFISPELMSVMGEAENNVLQALHFLTEDEDDY